MAIEARFKEEVSTNAAVIMLKAMKRLPGIWAQGRRARRIAETIPDLEVGMELPSNDGIYAWIEGICSTSHRRPGTPEGRRAETWVAEELKKMGIENVTMDPVPITLWSAIRWSLTAGGEEIPSFFIPNTGFTPPDGLTTGLVYVGKGGPAEMERAGVAGKIVVAEVTFPRLPTGLALKTLRSSYFLCDPEHSISLRTSQYLNFVRENFIGGAQDAESAPENDVYWQAQKHGAKGICLILRDQPSGSNSHYGPYDGMMKPMPGLWIGKYEGDRLRGLAKNSAEARLVLVGNSEPGVMHNVWGVLPGASDEVIMITSHHDSPFVGAIEDGSGVAQVLAQAHAWSRVPREKRPRTLVFVVDAGHFYGSEGALAFAREHPEIMRRTSALITLEHLAAKEVEERDREYADTGKTALTVMFTTPDPRMIAVPIKALRKKPVQSTAVVPSDLFAPVPTSDAAGYVLEAGVPVISWIGCPYYLLDEHDTLDKVARSELRPIAETVAEMVKACMVLPRTPSGG
jgi:hypothetical protein